MYLKESQPHPGGLPSYVCARLLDPVQREAMVNAASHVFLARPPFPCSCYFFVSFSPQEIKKSGSCCLYNKNIN